MGSVYVKSVLDVDTELNEREKELELNPQDSLNKWKDYYDGNEESAHVALEVEEMFIVEIRSLLRRGIPTSKLLAPGVSEATKDTIKRAHIAHGDRRTKKIVKETIEKKTGSSESRKAAISKAESERAHHRAVGFDPHECFKKETAE